MVSIGLSQLQNITTQGGDDVRIEGTIRERGGGTKRCKYKRREIRVWSQHERKQVSEKQTFEPNESDCFIEGNYLCTHLSKPYALSHYPVISEVGVTFFDFSQHIHMQFTLPHIIFLTYLLSSAY